MSDAITVEPSRPSASILNATDPNRTLAWIEGRIRDLYSTATTRHEQQQQLDRGAYLDIYNGVSNWVEIAKRSQEESRLYDILDTTIRSHCQDALQKIAALNNAAILSAYVKHWNAFLETQALVGHLFAYFERRWIRREVDEKRREVYLSDALHAKVWREEVLGLTESSDGSRRIVEAVKDEQGEAEESKVLGDVMNSFEELGVKMTDGSVVVMEKKSIQ